MKLEQRILRLATRIITSTTLPSLVTDLVQELNKYPNDITKLSKWNKLRSDKHARQFLDPASDHPLAWRMLCLKKSELEKLTNEKVTEDFGTSGSNYIDLHQTNKTESWTVIKKNLAAPSGSVFAGAWEATTFLAPQKYVTVLRAKTSSNRFLFNPTAIWNELNKLDVDQLETLDSQTWATIKFEDYQETLAMDTIKFDALAYCIIPGDKYYSDSDLYKAINKALSLL